LRAEYDPKRRSYVGEEAKWIGGEPGVEYCLVVAEDDEDNPHAWSGGLEKFWYDAKGDLHGELFTFATYESEAVFDADVEQILQEARTVSVKENIDEFLAVIDIIKQRAVAFGYETDTIDGLEGLFEGGPEDAYTLRDMGDEPRLHDHVECDAECWYFHVAPVVDREAQPLGWGLFAVHLPEVLPDASDAEVRGASRARILLLDHLHTKADALVAKHGFEYFMEAERIDNPEYAYMNDTEVLGGAALGAEWDDNTHMVVWQDCNGKALQDFLAGAAPFIYPREKWQPRNKSLVDGFFEQHPQPTWLEDQLRAAMDAQMGVDLDDDEDSPWQALNLE